MSDSYLAIAAIANDEWMRERVTACATQQVQLGSAQIPNVLEWVSTQRYVWAASPGWGQKWHDAYVAHPDEDAYEPGKDPEVITDGDILATVQSLA